MLTTIADQVQSLYLGYFGRAAEPGGYDYWVHQLTTKKMTLEQVAASFSVQSETKTKYAFLAGTSTDASSFIEQVYKNLFNRGADAEGKAYWMKQLAAATGNPDAIANFILNVISGAQGDDIKIIDNKVTAAADFTARVKAAEIETNVFFEGVEMVKADALLAARDVVDSEVTADPASITNSKAETTAYIDAHKEDKIQVVEKQVIVEKPVIVEKIVEKVVIVKEEVVVEVEVSVPGPTVYVNVPVEPVHETVFALNATLPLSSTKNYDGVEMGFGSGNKPTNYATILDLHAGELIGFKAHYRTGDDVPGVAGSNGVEVRWTMPAGAQSGLIGNEQGAHIDRSHASIDIVIDNGVGKAKTGEWKLLVDNNPTAAVNFQTFTLTEVAPNTWAFMNATNTAGQGMTSYNDGHVLADSMNLGFAFLNVPNGPAAGTGDVGPGSYMISLVGVASGVQLDAELVLV